MGVKKECTAAHETAFPVPCPRWILPFLDALSWGWQLCAAQRSLNRQTTQVRGHQVPLRKHPLLDQNVAVSFPLEALPGASTLSLIRRMLIQEVRNLSPSKTLKTCMWET